MQTQYRCELSAPYLGLCKNLVPYEPSSSNLDMAATYGYAPRYAELKSARDYFEGGFCGTYSSWVSGYDSTFLALWRRNNGSASAIQYDGVDDLSADCKFTSTTYGIIIGLYRAVPQLDYSHVGIDRNLLKTDATDFPIPELDSIGMQTQYRCELSAPIIGLCPKVFPEIGRAHV